jgi:sepiapterin reductase
MFHKCISIDHNIYSKGTTLRVLNYAPGYLFLNCSPLDTDMQTRIRNEMPDGEIKRYFVGMHNDDKLVKVKDSAMVLMRLLSDDLYSNGDHVDYYDTLDNKTAI